MTKADLFPTKWYIKLTDQMFTQNNNFWILGQSEICFQLNTVVPKDPTIQREVPTMGNKQLVVHKINHLFEWGHYNCDKCESVINETLCLI